MYSFTLILVAWICLAYWIWFFLAVFPKLRNLVYKTSPIIWDVGDKEAAIIIAFIWPFLLIIHSFAWIVKFCSYLEFKLWREDKK